MAYQVTDLYGVTRLMPDHRTMVEVLDTLYREAQHEDLADVVLTHRSGHAICLYANGTAVMEKEDDPTLLLMHDLSREEQLTLWIQLAAGRVANLLKMDWEKQVD
jgi:hypothetical protein